MHIPPDVWGPMFWATFHIDSLGYSDEPTYSEKRAAKEFFNAVPFVLPCAVCRDHFTEVLKGLPVETWLDNRKSLTEWVWMVHNRVNARLGKSEITQAEFYKRYNEMAERALPIPPANPTAEISDAMLTAAWTRGATTAAGVIVAAGTIGTLLWWSYSSR